MTGMRLCLSDLWDVKCGGPKLVRVKGCCPHRWGRGLQMKVSQDRLEEARRGEDLNTLLADWCVIDREKEGAGIQGLEVSSNSSTYQLGHLYHVASYFRISVSTSG